MTRRWLSWSTRWALAACTFFAVAHACRADPGGAAVSMRMSSSSFQHQQEIPSRHTCEGANLSPPLTWFDLPSRTKSLALIVDDPDAPDPRAPKTTWVHWVVYNIPSDVSSLPENVAASGLPAGAREGRNDWKTLGYRGPCPPIGRHRYFHKLYALDTVLPDLGGPDKAALERAMQAHVLAQGTLIGTYTKKGGR